MICTTLNKIRDCSPCKSGWNKLLKHLNKTKSDDALLPFDVILESNGLDDALWCTRSSPEHDLEWRLFAVLCARRVAHLNADTRVEAAIQAAEDYINGAIDTEQMNKALDDAAAARHAALAAAEWVVSSNASMSASGAAAWSALASEWASPWKDAEEEQKEIFIRIVNGDISALLSPTQ